MIFSDLPLAQRLERTEANSNAAFVEARARLHPASGAEWREVAGAYAMFDGPDSPLTQTFGLGLFAEATADDLGEIEAFFAARHAPVLHEISPLAPASLWPLLHARGYQPIEFTSVLYQELTAIALPEPPPGSAVRVRIIGPDEADAWAETAAAGWQSEAPELTGFIRELGQISAHSVGVSSFVAEAAGQLIATAGLYMHEGVALLAGASTVPAGRRQGAQAALLAARLQHAAAHGCTLATMGALPGGQSQRNAERRGFRIAYTRAKWQLLR
ncbi:GNAT family N-acetyltransferase [Hymenobacter terricola]|uniref:GNAT family N-acetyltransferase n=1 Tax=Hymenobacter terricola TaxID=2819236 RepID=UPI001B301A13|nr:GNAT family N-acetyltransferase [Hymenobacter terricola]